MLFLSTVETVGTSTEKEERWVRVDYQFGNQTFAGEVSREIRYYSIVEGEGQFFNPAQDFNRYAKK